jgi:hypothetical protein
MISLAECAPCKAMRLQAESEEEFRKRFGVVNAAPAMKGWRPYMGQATAIFPAVGTAPVQSSPYLDQTKQRLTAFAGRGIVAFPVGILINIAFKSLRRHRHEAMTFSAITAGIGMAAAFLPWESKILDTIAGLAGTLTGLGAAKMALPKKREEAINVVPI